MRTHYYILPNGEIVENRKEACIKLNISKKVFKILRVNELIKKIDK